MRKNAFRSPVARFVVSSTLFFSTGVATFVTLPSAREARADETYTFVVKKQEEKSGMGRMGTAGEVTDVVAFLFRFVRCLVLWVIGRVVLTFV